jgi:ComF family protein
MSGRISSPAKALFGAARFLARGAVDLVYPPHCLACGADTASEENTPLCARCRLRVTPVTGSCPTCGTPAGPHRPHEERCDSCRNRALHFTRATGAFLYDGSVKRLIHRMKFEGLSVSSRPLADLTLEVLRGHSFATEADALVPVPMHWRARTRRGYNQSERIAARVARGLGRPCENLLGKSRVTDPQVSLARAQRLDNPRGSFAVRSPKRVRGRTLLVFDDVMTTAATAAECARVLREAGAAKVYAFAVARQA